MFRSSFKSALPEYLYSASGSSVSSDTAFPASAETSDSPSEPAFSSGTGSPAPSVSESALSVDPALITFATGTSSASG